MRLTVPNEMRLHATRPGRLEENTSPTPALRSARQRGRLKARAICLGFMLCMHMLCAQSAMKESDVESAFLFNFARFMHKPGSSSGTFTIGVMGTNPFGGALEQITANEQIGGKAINIVQVTTPADALTCDIVFLSDSERPRLDKDLQALAGAPVLTVSTVPGFLQHGGMIQFSVISNHVRFSVNLDAATRSHITLSSELLKVALNVSGSPRQNEEPRP
jgi:hypothetical protein